MPKQTKPKAKPSTLSDEELPEELQGYLNHVRALACKPDWQTLELSELEIRALAVYRAISRPIVKPDRPSRAEQMAAKRRLAKVQAEGPGEWRARENALDEAERKGINRPRFGRSAFLFDGIDCVEFTFTPESHGRRRVQWPLELLTWLAARILQRHGVKPGYALGCHLCELFHGATAAALNIEEPRAAKEVEGYLSRANQWLADGTVTACAFPPSDPSANRPVWMTAEDFDALRNRPL